MTIQADKPTSRALEFIPLILDVFIYVEVTSPWKLPVTTPGSLFKMYVPKYIRAQESGIRASNACP
jgi:hypothetical protein